MHGLLRNCLADDLAGREIDKPKAESSRTLTEAAQDLEAMLRVVRGRAGVGVEETVFQGGRGRSGALHVRPVLRSVRAMGGGLAEVWQDSALMRSCVGCDQVGRVVCLSMGNTRSSLEAREASVEELR